MRENQANAPLVSMNAGLGIGRQEVLREVRGFREQLGRSVFVGGVPKSVSSGMLQRHAQQYAQVKYCALLARTHNDRARAAKVTFTNQEENNKAMVQYDSMVDEQILRVRAWVCRPKKKN